MTAGIYHISLWKDVGTGNYAIQDIVGMYLYDLGNGSMTSSTVNLLLDKGKKGDKIRLKVAQNSTTHPLRLYPITYADASRRTSVKFWKI